MKPIILLTSYFVTREEIKSVPIRGKLNQDLTICTGDYIHSIEKAGGVPMVAPSITDTEAIFRMFEVADGILFTGGEDVHPRYFGEDIEADNLEISDRRDNFELKLAEHALKSNKSILGICRGMQLLNVAAGGTLHQDLKTGIRHTIPNTPKEKLLHDVKISSNTRLYEIYQKESKEVNSFHHQAVKDLAGAYVPTAVAADGIIEAYEMKGERFVVGVQWHPEMLHEKYPEELAIFKAFIKSIKA